MADVSKNQTFIQNMVTQGFPGEPQVADEKTAKSYVILADKDFNDTDSNGNIVPKTMAMPPNIGVYKRYATANPDIDIVDKSNIDSAIRSNPEEVGTNG